MKHTIKNCIGTRAFAACAVMAFAFFSCKSAPLISEELSAQELIQNGQSAFEDGHYKQALRYFNAVVERYEDDPAVYIEAKYEIGHLYMKRKKYKAAVPILEEIRDIYPQVPPGTLPAAYEKLARLELAKLTDEQLEKIHAELEKDAAARTQANAGTTSAPQPQATDDAPATTPAVADDGATAATDADATPAPTSEEVAASDEETTTPLSE